MNLFQKKNFSQTTLLQYGSLLITGTGNGTRNLLHSSISGNAPFDEVWAYAYNISDNPVDVTVLFAGTGNGDRINFNSIASKSYVTLLPGLITNGQNLTRVYCSASGAVMLLGNVNTIYPI